ncbi:hypothetical protein GCM10023231_41380 [Olivibacter ginsenosidimutans]|uniref:DUF4198 domain-containing protein n=1 Tax=Olivibacter ginsenosidimutans TaxID=1176537 RepID=A0ABP9CCH6_9SPHI
MNGTTQFEFLASATVSVGKPEKTLEQALEQVELKVFPINATKWKVNQPVSLKVIQKGASKADAYVSILSPKGWSQGLNTAADGTVSFVPAWPGLYVIEVTNYEKTPGEYKGNKYEAFWQGSTYSFEVGK